MSRTSDDDFRTISLFKDLDGATLSDVAKASFVQTFPADVTLFGRGSAVTFVHAIFSGAVELSASHAGRHYTMLLRSAGSLLPLNPLAGNDIATCEAHTATRARIALIPVTLVRSLAAREPAVTKAVVQELSALNDALVRELHSRNLQKSHERLASWIHGQLVDGPDEQEVDLVIHKKLLAASIGMSQATLSREIEFLQAYGVAFKGRKIHVRSRSELEKVANLLVLPSSAPAPDPIGDPEL